MTNETLENLNQINEKIDLAVEKIKELEKENKKLRAARLKQAEYIDNLIFYVFSKADTELNYESWFNQFSREMNRFYEGRNNKCVADSPDSNSMHPGNDILQSGCKAAGTDKGNE